MIGHDFHRNLCVVISVWWQFGCKHFEEGQIIEHSKLLPCSVTQIAYFVLVDILSKLYVWFTFSMPGAQFDNSIFGSRIEKIITSSHT